MPNTQVANYSDFIDITLCTGHLEDLPKYGALCHCRVLLIFTLSLALLGLRYLVKIIDNVYKSFNTRALDHEKALRRFSTIAET